MRPRRALPAPAGAHQALHRRVPAAARLGHWRAAQVRGSLSLRGACPCRPWYGWHTSRGRRDRRTAAWLRYTVIQLFMAALPKPCLHAPAAGQLPLQQRHSAGNGHTANWLCACRRSRPPVLPFPPRRTVQASDSLGLPSEIWVQTTRELLIPVVAGGSFFSCLPLSGISTAFAEVPGSLGGAFGSLAFDSAEDGGGTAT